MLKTAVTRDFRQLIYLGGCDWQVAFSRGMSSAHVGSQPESLLQGFSEQLQEIEQACLNK